MSERQGIEIDYCPLCRGVWLDRGELDKIIERAAPAAPPVSQAAPPRGTQPTPIPPYDTPRYHRDDDDDDDRRRYDQNGRPRRKRESFLDDLFDFG